MSEASTPPAGAPPDRPGHNPSPPAPEGGAPIPPDAIDGDLVKLRRPRPQIGVVTALAIVIMCAYLAVRLHADRRFSSEPDAPRDVAVGDVVAGRVEAESHVALTARIERVAAVRTTVGPADPGLRLAPVLGSGDHLWLAVPGNAWLDPITDARFAGRLRALSDVRFAEPARERLARPQPRFVAGAELLRARMASADGGSLTSVSGTPLLATAATPVEVEVPDPTSALVIGTFNERFGDAAAWTAALAQVGLIAPGAAAVRSDRESATFEVHGPDAMVKARQKLDAASLWGARVEAVAARHQAPWRDLVVTADSIAFPGGAALPWSAVDVAALWLPRALPADARVLLVGEAPAQYWYVLPIYVAVIVFGALFLWALVRAVRRDILGGR